MDPSDCADDSATLAPASPVFDVSALVFRTPRLSAVSDDVPGVRRRPVQRRGVETMNVILDAALALLEERGLEGFTTNAIAERANVNIATIYGYFEDKVAILHELSARDEQRRVDALTQLAATHAEGGDWRVLTEAVIDRLVEVRMANLGSIAVTRAVDAVPELRHLHADRDERFAGHLADVLRMVRADLDPIEARRAARPVAIAGAYVLNRAVEHGEIDAELVEGFRQMVTAHLEQVLG